MWWDQTDDHKYRSWCSGEHYPLSKYHTLFPNQSNKSRFPKPNALLQTAHTWISHDSSPKPFLGHFVAEVMHASEPRLYLTHFCMFEDVTSPHIILFYATSERLGIITFNVPNLAATSWVGNIAVPTPLPKEAWARLLSQSPYGTPCRDQQATLQWPSPYLPQGQEEDCFPKGKFEETS